MVQEGMALGQKVSAIGLEVDRGKIVAIEKLPLPNSIKGVRRILGHAGFYYKFIENFTKNSKSLCLLLEKDVKFSFDAACFKAFEKLKTSLISAPVLTLPTGLTLLFFYEMLVILQWELIGAQFTYIYVEFSI